LEEPAVVQFLRCLVFAFACVSCAQSAEKIAAVVNGEAITLAELDASLPPTPREAPSVSAAQSKQQRMDALQMLIDDRMVRQFLKQQGAKVEASEVERQYSALEAGLKAQGRTVEAYLKEGGLTVAQLKENFLRMLQLSKYVDAQLAGEPLKAYFEANKDFFDRTTVRTSQIVVRVSATATPAERQKAIEKLRDIRSNLAARKIDFASAAKLYSQSPSGLSGGDIGYIVRKFQVEEAYARTAFSMKVGEVSDVVETEAGFFLIWVTDRKPGKGTRYEDVTQDVRECCEAELKQALLAELRKKAKIEIRLQ
jgi:parvulin-like peptidyl-prolyl isomerase